MITGYFGTPGCGKTTILTIIAQKELKRIRKGKSPYKHVLTNFYCKGCERFNVQDLGLYKFTDSLILIDEISLDLDSRDFKNFSKGLRDFFVLHRHLNDTIYYFAQDFEKVDKVIRNLTYDLWYVKRPILPLFKQFSIAKRIFRNININEYSSELTLGYRFASFLEIVFSPTKKIYYRRPYYKYFDSYDELQIGERTEFIYVAW